MSSQRTRLACAACTRRKVKCSKTVPCTNCIRRGEGHTCSADPGPVTPGRNTPSSSFGDRGEVDSLRSRILELEAALHTRNPSVDPRPATALSSNVNLNSYEEDEPGPAGGNDDGHTSTEATDPVVEDAASILEFLAWGRRKNPDYNSVISPEASAHVGSSSVDVGDAQPDSSFQDVLDGAPPVASLQLLLPNKRQIWELVRYHEDALLWFHCSYYAPAFRSQLEVFYNRFGGSVNNSGLNVQWLALLFAVLTGSLTCVPKHQAIAWGFKAKERDTLSKRWFRAVYTCLNATEYAANQSILSVQAISTLTISAHLLGFSNVHSIHLAAVIRIAQGLGLHRISDDASGSTVDKECGRRLWSQLCCQDWFSIPFSDTYLISPAYSQSEPPMNCHDHDMLSQPASVPTITTYTRLLTRIASIMPQLQDDLMSCNTLFTKYEQVIKWDKQMRTLSTSERPAFLSNAPLDASWPCYVPWARRSLAISSAHKIIMIHRCFLSESFTNPVFSFTRRTCLAASKTIIKEFKLSMTEGDPLFWTHQAFSVAACVILILDALHRNADESEQTEHSRLVGETVDVLQQCNNSMIAARGVKLLSALLKEVSTSDQALNSRKRRHDGSQVNDDHGSTSASRRKSFNVSTFVKEFCGSKNQHNGSTAMSTENAPTRNGMAPGVTNMPFTPYEANPSVTGPMDSLSNRMPFTDATFLMPGLDGTTAFDDLLYLANHDFSFT